MENNQLDYMSILGQVDLDDVYIQLAFEYYFKRYADSHVARSFIATSNFLSEQGKTDVRFGLCDRTLGRHIQSARCFEGAAIRGSLQRVGLIRPTGHELFRGCVIVPEFNADKQVIKATGYRYQKRLRHWDVPVVAWERPAPQAFIESGMNAVRQLIYG